MTRKRFIKLMMGLGVSRNRARHEAKCIVVGNKHAEKVNRNAARREWEAICQYIAGNRAVSLKPILRNKTLSYQEAWDERQLHYIGRK